MKNKIGANIEDLTTPCIVVFEDKLNNNIELMKNKAKKFDVNIRPHIKTHKSSYVAKKQINEGAVGICCATIDECECMAENGINNILLANEIVTSDKILRAVELSKTVNINFAVENIDVVSIFDKLSKENKTYINLFLDYDTGYGRCGIKTYDEALNIAEKIKHSEYLKLKGLMSYNGGANFIKNKEEREKTCEKSYKEIEKVVNLLDSNDIKLETISVAGTGNFEQMAKFDKITEIQPGSYVYSDNIYRKQGVEFQNSMFVLSTIISKFSNKIVFDAGKKAISSDYPDTVVLDDNNIEMTFMSDEHYEANILDGDTSKYNIGDKYLLIPAHCCTTNYQHSKFYLIDRNNKVKDIIKIDCR